jgi:hypothetical protein
MERLSAGRWDCWGKDVSGYTHVGVYFQSPEGQNVNSGLNLWLLNKHSERKRMYSSGVL